MPKQIFYLHSQAAPLLSLTGSRSVGATEMPTSARLREPACASIPTVFVRQHDHRFCEACAWCDSWPGVLISWVVCRFDVNQSDFDAVR